MWRSLDWIADDELHLLVELNSGFILDEGARAEKYELSSMIYMDFKDLLHTSLRISHLAPDVSHQALRLLHLHSILAKLIGQLHGPF